MELPFIAAGSASSGSAERPHLYRACVFSVILYYSIAGVSHLETTEHVQEDV